MISIVVPAYNEEENIKNLIPALLDIGRKNKWDFEIVISEDHSSDNSPKILDEMAKKHAEVRVIHRRDGNRGMGYTLREGTMKAKGDIIIWTMADLSDDPNTFPKMVEKINQGYDMVLGSRYMKGGSSGDIDPMKAFYSSLYSKISKILFGLKVDDITNAFRAFKKDIFKPCNIQGINFEISPEFAIKAHLLKYKVGQVPTGYTNRVAGRTSFKMFQMGLKYGSLFRYAIFRPKRTI